MAMSLALIFLMGAVFTVKATPEFIRVKRWGGDSNDDLSSMFRGTAGVDYPNYKTIPQTSFQCSEQLYSGGLYADVETQCQVYHVCQEGRKDSFLCGKGTIFNQQLLTCDYWYSTECETAPNYYYLNAKIADSQPKTIQGSGPFQSTHSRPAHSQGTHLQNTPGIPQRKPGNQGILGQGVISGISQYNQPSQNSYSRNQQGTYQKSGQYEIKKVSGQTGQYNPEGLPGDTGYYNPGSLPGGSGQYQPENIPGDSGQYRPENIPGDSGQYNPAQLPGESGQYYSEKVEYSSGLGIQRVTSQGRNQYPAGYLKSTAQHQAVSQGSSSSGYQPTYPVVQRTQSGQSSQISGTSYQQVRKQAGNYPQTIGISKGSATSTDQKTQGPGGNVPGAIIAQRQQSGPWSFPTGGMMMMGGPGDR